MSKNLDNDTKLEDVLKSIKGIINSRNKVKLSEDDHRKDQSQEYDVKKEVYIQEKQKIENSNEMENKLDQEEILELTEIFDDTASNNVNNDSSSIISSDTKNVILSEVNKFINYLAENKKSKLTSNSSRDQDLDPAIANLLRPIIMEWLDLNLHNTLKNVICDEIRKIIKDHK